MSITIAPTDIYPDHVAAVIARLRRVTDLMALCPDETIGGRTVRRISGALQAVPTQKGWEKHAIVVQDGVGQAGDLTVPRSRPQVDCVCYAASGYEANRVARLVAAALCPASRRVEAFTEANCRIVDVFWVAGPIAAGYDAENKAHRRVVSFELDKSDLPVGVS